MTVPEITPGHHLAGNCAPSVRSPNMISLVSLDIVKHTLPIPLSSLMKIATVRNPETGAASVPRARYAGDTRFRPHPSIFRMGRAE